MAKRRERAGRSSAFTVAPEVLIDNALSHQFTVIEVAGLDRPGLLYELTNALSDLNLDITSAHITTFGERAVDVFYVTDLTDKKIANPQRPEGHPRAPAGGAGRRLDGGRALDSHGACNP
jgi:[protein-PII] uridylyltransferase